MDQVELDNLVRRIADDEATPDERAEFERWAAERPTLAGAVETEQRLHAAVRRVMSAETETPADLERRVRMALRSASAGHGGTELAPRRRRLIPSGLAAGILIIVAASIIFGILGRSTSPDWGPLRDRAGYLFEIFVDAHRWSIENPSSWRDDGLFRDVSEACEWLRRFNDRDVAPPDLSSVGFEYAGARPLGAGLHLRYRRPSDSSTISFYIQDLDSVRIKAREALQAGVPYRSRDLAAEADLQPSQTSYLWISGPWLFALVNGEDSEEALRLARSAGMPAGEIQDF